eukprot:3329454-Amphidinium_carterae.1
MELSQRWRDVSKRAAGSEAFNRSAGRVLHWCLQLQENGCVADLHRDSELGPVGTLTSDGCTHMVIRNTLYGHVSLLLVSCEGVSWCCRWGWNSLTSCGAGTRESQESSTA